MPGYINIHLQFSAIIVVKKIAVTNDFLIKKESAYAHFYPKDYIKQDQSPSILSEGNKQD